MNVSMENIESSPECDPEAHDRLLFPQGSQLPPSAQPSSVQNDGTLMPPPLGPPKGIPWHLSCHSGSAAFISPSKEGEVPMEFSPGIKRHIEKAYKDHSPKAYGFSLRSENAGQADSSFVNTEMHPSEIFRSSPGSPDPDSEFRAILDESEVKESPSGSSDDNFLKRQEKPNIRRCRSLEMRKRLFDMSNTPPNAFKSNFKRPATVDTGDQNDLAKRPRDLMLSAIKETCPGRYAREVREDKHVQREASREGDLSDHERIKVAVDVLQSPDVIGDCSREHCLPVVIGKHSDLKNISHETMAHLLKHGFQGKFDKLTVIDCRYPYEYEGGHIKDAINLYTEEHIDAFLKHEMQEGEGKGPKIHILIFHCEFSSQRGPGLLRHLRKLDRKENLHQYPLLTFPEMYVLHLGYKEFFHNHPHLCTPSAYVPMADESYVNDLRHFRAKAKSWAAGEKTRSSKR